MSEPAIRVLLIEDDDHDAMLIRAQLQGVAVPRLEVERAAQLESGLRTLQEGSFDALLLDLSLPDAFGLGTVLRARDAAPGMPIVVLTGQSDPELAIRVIHEGAQDFVEKGADAQAIARTIRFAIERNALQQEILHRWRVQVGFLTAHSVLGDGNALLEAHTGRLIHVNQAWCAIFGYSEEEMLALASADLLVVASERAAWRDRCDRLVRGELLPPWHVAGLHKSGARVDLEMSCRYVQGPAGPQVVAVVHDVTELKRAQARLMVADRMISVGTLAAGVAHEINNPLTYVVANLGVALEIVRARPDPELDGPLSDAASGAERVRHIVQDLRVFSRIEDDERSSVDLRSAIDTALSLTANELRHRAQVVCDLGHVPRVLASESRLAQVVVNLLLNAAQALPVGHAEGNEVRVTTYTDAGGHAVLEIRDTGSGIPPELVARVFDPFFTTKPVGEGTGLGLSICHGIVTALGGSIELECPVGHGCTARVVLPPASGEAAVRAGTPS